MNKYVSFCREENLRPFPLHEGNVIIFVTSLATAASYSAINIYLAGIKFVAKRHGFNSDFSKFNRLYLVIRGIKRAQGDQFKKAKRAPVTPNVLMVARCRLFNSSRNFGDKVMIWAAMLCAYFVFLRVSEYTADYVKSYDEYSTLCFSDLKTYGTGYILHIKVSKTDPFRVGSKIRFAPNNSILCPVTALREYIAYHPSRTGPLFAFQDRSYLTRSRWTRILHSVMSAATGVTYSSHSFRIGAATTAAARGYPRWLIQSLGRWSSDCFRDYIRVPDSTIQQVSKEIIHQPVADTCFDPDLA